MSSQSLAQHHPCLQLLLVALSVAVKLAKLSVLPGNRPV
jgi:hypothetical protein